jgi:pyrroloquinoline quinone biosynthesis protein B
MKIIILGSGAGGGCPQWNSNSIACMRSRSNRRAFPVMSQCSIAFSVDELNWFVVNASPDIRQQVDNTVELWPITSGQIRNSPIKGVILTNAEIDSITGLLTLREKHKFSLFATPAVQEILRNNLIFKVVDENLVQRVPLRIDKPLYLEDDLVVKAFAVPGVNPLYTRKNNEIDDLEFTIGILVEHKDKKVVFIPACAGLTSAVLDVMYKSDVVLFDGTFWTDEEMIKLGAGDKTSKQMGHVAINDLNGILSLSRDLKIKSKYFIHMNNTNPILYDKDIIDYMIECGWKKTYDGQRIYL